MLDVTGTSAGFTKMNRYWPVSSVSASRREFTASSLRRIPARDNSDSALSCILPFAIAIVIISLESLYARVLQ